MVNILKEERRSCLMMKELKKIWLGRLKEVEEVMDLILLYDWNFQGL
jgi:hypothetical protein